MDQLERNNVHERLIALQLHLAYYADQLITTHQVVFLYSLLLIYNYLTEFILGNIDIGGRR